MADRPKIDIEYASRLRMGAKKEGGSSTVKGSGADFGATEREKLSSGLGTGKTAKGGGSGMPKQSDYATTAAWSEAMRKWREGQRTQSAQKKALAGM
jgi:hypothetical protein